MSWKYPGIFFICSHISCMIVYKDHVCNMYFLIMVYCVNSLIEIKLLVFVVCLFCHPMLIYYSLVLDATQKMENIYYLYDVTCVYCLNLFRISHILDNLFLWDHGRFKYIITPRNLNCVTCSTGMLSILILGISCF